MRNLLLFLSSIEYRLQILHLQLTDNEVFQSVEYNQF